MTSTVARPMQPLLMLSPSTLPTTPIRFSTGRSSEDGLQPANGLRSAEHAMLHGSWASAPEASVINMIVPTAAMRMTI